MRPSKVLRGGKRFRYGRDRPQSSRAQMPVARPEGAQGAGEALRRRSYRCAILDDYQNVALQVADWSPVAKDLDIKVFNEPLGGQDKVIRALADFEIVCGMRERTPFPRAVIEALPKLRLLITTGARNASFDLEAAKERDVVVCGTPGTGNPTAEMAVGLMLELTRRIGFDNARMKSV